MVGLGSLGRIERKVEDIKENLPSLMNKIDQMCAEFRILGDKASVLSDHTDDEKFVWKTFRRKLHEAGFTSKVLREHESALFLRIRELTECGLLDAEDSNSTLMDDELPQSLPQIVRLPYGSSTMMASTDRGAIFEKTTVPPSRDIKSSISTESLRSFRRRASESSHLEQNWDTRTKSACQDSVPQVDSRSFSNKMRIWRNPGGEALLKGTFLKRLSRNKTSLVAIIDTNKEEVLIPCPNLSEADLQYVNKITERSAKYEQQAKGKNKALSETSPTSFEEEKEPKISKMNLWSSLVALILRFLLASGHDQRSFGNSGKKAPSFLALRHIVPDPY